MYISLSLSIYIHFTHTLLTHTHTTPLRQLISKNSSHTYTHSSLTQMSHTTHLTHTHTTPLTGKSQTVKVLRLPRKRSARCTKCCACHANARGPSRRPNARRQVPDSQSAAPATQKQRHMHRVLRLPRKSSGRCTKRCACHANMRAVPPGDQARTGKSQRVNKNGQQR